jgi:hypothetical protein
MQDPVHCSFVAEYKLFVRKSEGGMRRLIRGDEPPEEGADEEELLVDVG